MPPSSTKTASREAPRSTHTIPRIAIVGRPNVGKSSLVNMLAARRVSIVDDTPGTTRDRVSAIVPLEGERPDEPGIQVELIDTGGFGVYTVEGRRVSNDGQDLAPLGVDVERQIAFAVDSADLVLFVIDTQAGVTAQDREIARLLREGGLGGTRARDAATRAAGTQPVSEHGRVVVLANKCDGPRWEAHAFEAATLGFGEAIIVSAKNNYNRRHLIERLYEIARRTVRGAGGGQPESAGVAPDMHLAIVGKRNAGKSTLVNTLAGEQRVIVSEIAGTTRDAVDVRFEVDGRTFVAIDTAGLRKRKSFQDRIEWWALDRCHLAIQRADVCLLMVDATIPISAVDKQLGMMVADAFKPVVIVVNKWDLAEGRPLADGRAKRGRPRPVTTGHYEQYLRAELKGLWYAPIAFMSARNDRNVRETIDLAFDLFNQSQTRTTTGKLNRVVRGILEHQRPPSGSGAFAKLLYVAQVAVSPPTIVCVVNYPELFTPTYQRFLLNRFREELPFTEVPIKLLIRGRRRDEVIETAEGEIARVRDEVAEAETPPAAPAHASADAEAIDWSIEEPGEDASKYFDEPPPRGHAESAGRPSKADRGKRERVATGRSSPTRARPVAAKVGRSKAARPAARPTTKGRRKSGKR